MDIAVIRDVLECHVCFDTMKGPVHACDTGHSICDKCFKRVTCCPICKQNYSGARNFVAERLCDELIKLEANLKNKSMNSEGIVTSPGAASNNNAPAPGTAMEIDEVRVTPRRIFQSNRPWAHEGFMGNCLAQSRFCRVIPCTLTFDSSNNSNVDFLEYINHLRFVHGVSLSEGATYSKRFAAKGSTLVRAGSSKMFIVNFHEKNILFTAHEEAEEIFVWAMTHGSPEEICQYKVKLTLQTGEFEPRERKSLTTWSGHVHSIRTPTPYLGTHCLRFASSLLLDRLPQSKSVSWWLLKSQFVHNRHQESRYEINCHVGDASISG